MSLGPPMGPGRPLATTSPAKAPGGPAMWSSGCTRLLPARIGWSRAATVTQVRALYVADGL
ncbi:hypothetical protein [Streptomyces exfoliatus]|uniref:hypothetical protein n=1 Tax=Streptomyces exfoliatus TaxID=1905 RepID=UPI003C2C5E8E